MGTNSRSFLYVVHQSGNIRHIDCNNMSCSFLFDENEQPCWISLPHSIFSCTFTGRAMRLTSTPLNCFALTTSIFSNTWYSKVILCSQKWKHFVSRTTHLVTTTQYDTGYTLLLRHKEGIEDTQVQCYTLAKLYCQSLILPMKKPLPSKPRGLDLVMPRHFIHPILSAANMQTCQCLWIYLTLHRLNT